MNTFCRLLILCSLLLNLSGCDDQEEMMRLKAEKEKSALIEMEKIKIREEEDQKEREERERQARIANEIREKAIESIEMLAKAQSHSEIYTGNFRLQDSNGNPESPRLIKDFDVLTSKPIKGEVNTDSYLPQIATDRYYAQIFYTVSEKDGKFSYDTPMPPTRNIFVVFTNEGNISKIAQIMLSPLDKKTPFVSNELLVEINRRGKERGTYKAIGHVSRQTPTLYYGPEYYITSKRKEFYSQRSKAQKVVTPVSIDKVSLYGKKHTALRVVTESEKISEYGADKGSKVQTKDITWYSNERVPIASIIHTWDDIGSEESWIFKVTVGFGKGKDFKELVNKYLISPIEEVIRFEEIYKQKRESLIKETL